VRIRSAPEALRVCAGLLIAAARRLLLMRAAANPLLGARTLAANVRGALRAGQSAGSAQTGVVTARDAQGTVGEAPPVLLQEDAAAAGVLRRELIHLGLLRALHALELY